MGKIVVVGSSNTDMVIRSERLPRPGESVVGGDFMMAGGGKGANQAVAVARMGHKVVFVTAVGRDMFGDNALKNYAEYGVDTSFAARKDVPSGIALIMVDGCAQNSISVALGANSKLCYEDVLPALETLEEGDIVLLQLEIPMQTVEEVAAYADKRGAKVVLNPAPAAKLSAELLSSLYLITPNQTEAEFLTGVEVNDFESAKRAASVLRNAGVERVVITMGGSGAFIDDGENAAIVPAYVVDAVDTTAAGDVFNGAMCSLLAEGGTLAEAIEFATKASAISVTRAGAQPSIPTRDEVDSFNGKK